MYQKVYMENVAIVLHDTRIPENIGAAARAAANMGVGQVILSAPRNFDMERVLKLATHTASGLVEAMKICNTFPEALGAFNWIVRNHRKAWRYAPGEFFFGRSCHKTDPHFFRKQGGHFFAPRTGG